MTTHEEYEMLDMEVIRFEAMDIVTASGDGGDETPLDH